MTEDTSGVPGVPVDDNLSLSDIVSGNDMTRHVLNTISLDTLHHDQEVYPRPFVEATAANTLDYVHRIANVKGATGLRPRNKVIPSDIDWETMSNRFGYIDQDLMKKTWAITTQLGSIDVRHPLRRHYKSRFPGANVKRIHETFSTDTMFRSTPAIGGDTCCQVFVGNTSSFTAVYGMKREGEGLGALEQFVTDWGAPDTIKRDNSKMQNSTAWTTFERKMQIKSATSEPHQQNQNQAERRIQTIKNGTRILMDKTGTPKFMWLECMKYFVSILNTVCLDQLGGRNAYKVALGHSVDISAYIQFEWWEPVYYLDTEDPSFPHSKEKLGYFSGVAENCGDLLTFNIYVPDTHQRIPRSVLRSAKHDNGKPNLRALNPHYDGELEEAAIYISPAEAKARLEEIRDMEEKDEASFTIDHLIEEADLMDRIAASAGESPTIISSADMEDDDERMQNVVSSDSIPDPIDVIGLTFPIEQDGTVYKAEVKEKLDDGSGYLIELKDGSRQTVEYNLIIDKYNSANDPEEEFYTYSGLLDHRKIKRRWEVLVNWDGYKPEWQPLAHMKKQDPITRTLYARDKGIEDLPGWKWTKSVRHIDPSRLVHLARQVCKATNSKVKYQFGVRVPNSHREAVAIDKENNNNLWGEAIRKELSQLLEFETFNILETGERAPQGYQQIPMIMTFAVKHDGRRKSRLVAGGHVTAPPTEDVYSTVVAPEGIRCVILQAEINDLTVWGGDVGNAYLNGTTREKVHCILGPEFGPELQGRVAVVVKSFYGLKTSCARWCEHLADTLRGLGWFRSEAMNDIWMKDCDTHYEYITVYSDDLVVASKDPKAVYDTLEHTYTLKGVGEPEYYLGAAVGRMKGDFNEKGSTTTLSAKVYLQNLITKIEESTGTLRSYTVPMDPAYKPELDESPILGDAEASQFRMLTGSAQWAVTLGRMDIQYATMILARYNMCPREGHLTAMKKLFGYLKSHVKGKILFDTRPLKLDHEVEYFAGSNWKQIYGDIKEELPPNMPKPKMKPVEITIYFDASHACDMITRRSVTGIIVFINSTPIRWYSKKQNTVESSTYGSEMVAGRIATEMAIEFRYVFRMLGSEINGPVRLLGDNRGMIQSSSLMSSQLKKKHNAIAFSRIRESVAMSVTVLGHIKSDTNYSDICTKALNGPKLHGFVKRLLFRTSDSGECEESNPISASTSADSAQVDAQTNAIVDLLSTIVHTISSSDSTIDQAFGKNEQALSYDQSNDQNSKL